MSKNKHLVWGDYTNWQYSKKYGLRIIKRGGNDIFCYSANKSMALLWFLCSGAHSQSEIFQKIIFSIHVRPEIIKEKFNNCIKELIKEGLLEETKEKKNIMPVAELKKISNNTFKFNPKLKLIAKEIGENRDWHTKLRTIVCDYCSERAQLYHPELINFEITYNCNLRCKTCFFYKGFPKKIEEIKTEKYLQAIKNIHRSGASIVHFLGGEPFLRKDLSQLVKFAKNKGLRVIVSTNGTLLTEKNLKELKSSGLDYLAISLDGGDSETHDKIRGEGTFDEVVKGIKKANKVGLPISICFVLTKEGFRTIFKAYRLSKKLGVRHFSLLPFVATGRGEKYKKQIKPKLYQYFLLRVFYIVMNSKLFSNSKISFHARTKCQGPYFLSINPKGDVSFCNIAHTAPLKKIFFGNIFEKELFDIWRSEDFTNLFVRELYEPCRSCLFKFSCDKLLCRIIRLTQNEELHGGSIACLRGRISQKILNILDKLNITL